MQSLSDNHTGVTWIAAASLILPEACLRTLQCQPEAASIQAQLQVQALAEREIRQAGENVASSSRKLLGDIPRGLQQVQWSPCNSWIAITTFSHGADNLYVLPASEGYAAGVPTANSEAVPIPGIRCDDFAWLAGPTGRLLISHNISRGNSVLKLYSAPAGALADRLAQNSVPGRLDCMLSPCNTLVLKPNPHQDPLSGYHLWHILRAGDFSLQAALDLRQSPSATYSSCAEQPPWSHDCSWIAVCLGCQGDPMARVENDILICAATSGEPQHVLVVGQVCTYRWSPAANTLAFVTRLGGLKLWHASTSSCTPIAAAIGGDLPTVKWAPDGKYFLLGASWGPPGPEREFVSYIVSAAGSITWGGGMELCGLRAGQWSGNGAVCMGAAEDSPGRVLVSTGGTDIELKADFANRIDGSSLSSCGLVIVATTFPSRSRSWNARNVVQYKVDALEPPADVVSTPLPFQVDVQASCPAWHPMPRLSMIYAMADVNGFLWIVDGSTGKALHSWQWPHLAGSQAPHGQGSWSLPKLTGTWSPTGRRLCVVQSGCLVIIDFGSLSM